MLNEIQLFTIATVATVIVWLLKMYKKDISNAWLTGGVYVTSFVLAFFFAPLALPPFPPFVDLVSFGPALVAWVGELLIPVSAFVGFATLIYNALLKAVLDKYASPFLSRFLGSRSRLTSLMNGPVRCKFTCIGATKRPDGKDANGNLKFLYDYEFSPVTSGSDENTSFWKYTPSGSIKLSTVRYEFVPGQSYYLDFMPSEYPA